MPHYLCSECDHFVSGLDLQPVTSYMTREIKKDRPLVGQCICGGLVYEVNDNDVIAHMERELKAKGLSICP